MAVAAVPLVIAGASAALGAYGSISAGNAKAQAGRMNAAFQEQAAQMTLDQAQAEAEQVRTNNLRKMGDITAAYSASGVQVGTGSPLDVMSDAATQGELSRKLVLYQGAVKALELREGAQLDLQQASAAQTAGYIQAGSTVLSAAGKAYGGGSFSNIPKAA